MNVVISLEYRFDRTPDGAVWTQTAYSYDEFFAASYLHVFDAVRLIARVRDVPSVPPQWRRVDGPRVAVAGLPHYVGPSQYVRAYASIARAIRRTVGAHDAVMVRVPSQIAAQLTAQLEPGRPFAVQVVGDPYDAFSPGAIRHPLRPLLRQWFTRRLRAQCAAAAAASYVNRHALQRRYPSSGHIAVFSDLQLRPPAFVSEAREVRASRGRLTLLTIGSLENLHKAPEVQIDALAACVRRGLDLQLRLVGDGQCQPALEAQVRRRGLADRVTFAGRLTAGEAVRAELDRADLFLMPSKTEGLPRALIEAMARGLPCIGTSVGGIPELLAAEDLVPRDDAEALADRIEQVVSSPTRMREMSRRNLAKAGEYRADLLHQRRLAFYTHVRRVTEEWVNQPGPGHSVLVEARSK